jgi:hypothetical protein
MTDNNHSDLYFFEYSNWTHAAEGSLDATEDCHMPRGCISVQDIQYFLLQSKEQHQSSSIVQPPNKRRTVLV